MVSFGVIRDYARVWTRSPLAITLQLCRSAINPEAPYLAVAQSAGTTIEEVRRVVREAERTGLDDLVRKSVQVSELGLQPSKALYALCRILKPRTIVETGVAEGISSAFILKALSENSQGTLYSIDGAEFTENGMESGYMVPESLKARWSFRKGWSQGVLSPLLEEVGSIDMFFHDSDHSYEVVRFEIETAYPYLRNGATMLADDVFQTKAFFDACKRFGIRPMIIGLRLGLGRKQTS